MYALLVNSAVLSDKACRYGKILLQRIFGSRLTAVISFSSYHRPSVRKLSGFIAFVSESINFVFEARVTISCSVTSHQADIGDLQSPSN